MFSAAQLAARSGDPATLMQITQILVRRAIEPADFTQAFQSSSTTLSHAAAVELLRALTTYRTPAPWKVLGVVLQRQTVLRPAFLEWADTALTGIPAAHELLVRETVVALGVEDSGQAQVVMRSPVIARDMRVADALIGVLTRGARGNEYRKCIESLVALTDISAAPFVAEVPDPRTSSQAGQFWLRWQQVRTTNVAPVLFERGQIALQTRLASGRSPQRRIPPSPRRSAPPRP